MRAVARRAKARHAFDEAREWAEKTLEKAGLPAVVGWYAPGPDGRSLIPAPPGLIGRENEGHGLTLRLRPDEQADAPWVAMLPQAVARLGYASDTDERRAAELLHQLALVGQHIREGDAMKAAGVAFYAGMRWKGRQMDRLARIGADHLRGAKMAGRANAKHDDADKLQWMLADRRLQREAAGLSGRQRAENLAPKFGADPETFRKEVGKFRRRTDPKK
jgi:hypothetical protein